MSIFTLSATRSFALRPLAVIAIAAGGLLSAPLQAAEQVVDIGKIVTTEGLDVNAPAGAQRLYFRLVRAASLVCGDGLRVGLEPVLNRSNCIDKSVAAAVRSSHLPQLAVAYQKAHALQAATHEIAVPTILAAK